MDKQFFIYAFDLFGTFFFAISGASVAIKHRLDILGLITLSVFTAAGGGMLRDIIIGEFPPVFFRDINYFIISVVAGFLTFLFYDKIQKRIDIVKYADAIGLGVFTAIGASKAYDFNLNMLTVVSLGTLTGVGGGAIRDILVREVPIVLRADFYASASIIGASLYYLLVKYLGFPLDIGFIFCFITTTFLRIIAIKKNIELPKLG